MPQLDPSSFASQLFWLAVSFGLLYFLMSQVALPKVSNVLRVRKEKISNDLDRAKQLTLEAEKTEKEYLEDIAKTRDKATKLIADAVAKSSADADEKHAELDAKLAKKLSEAEASIIEAKDKALDEMAKTSSILSRQIVKRLAKIDVSQASSDKSVKELLNRKVA